MSSRHQGDMPASSTGDVDKIAYSELPHALGIAAGDLHFVVSRYLQIEDRLDTTPDTAPAWRIEMIDMLAQLEAKLDQHHEQYRRLSWGRVFE